MKTKSLSEQVAIITGGGTGIGRAFAEALAAAGVRVIIASRREEVLRQTATELNGRLPAESVFPYACDILDHVGEARCRVRFGERQRSPRAALEFVRC